MKAQIKHEYKTNIFGDMKYISNGNLIFNGKEFTKDRMQEIANEYKGCNRIYKPVPLLFWTDCKNGQFSNWKK